MTRYNLTFNFNDGSYACMACGVDTQEQIPVEIEKQFAYYTWYPQMTVDVTETCQACKGKGDLPRTKRVTKHNWWDTVECKECKGKGVFPVRLA